jgi:peptidyl-prolyl cis-trans isomerase C
MRIESVVLRRMAREPLIHFLLIGGAIFGFYGLAAEPEASAPADRIVVTTGEIDRLGNLWEKRWQRQPSGSELRRLIDEHVREEVLYREALALGLDRDDAVFRRLLRQKLEFVTQDLAVALKPEAVEVAAWFEANRERYRTPTRVSFTQVFVDLDRRGATGESNARVLLAGLREGSVAPEAVGDGLLLDASYDGHSMQEIEGLFGSEFTEALLGLAPGEWSGPIASGYGLHLVRLDARSAGVIPPLAQIETRVRADIEYERRQQANEDIYQRFLARYEVVVEDAAEESTGTEDGGARP